jgi:hypothetical protein
MTPSILVSPLKYENNEANTPNTNVFNDTDAFQHIIYIYIFIFILKKLNFLLFGVFTLL